MLASVDDIEDFVDNCADQISPNVALRPLYQETILPNLIYVGGPSELKYWMQLKPSFERNNTPFPMVYPRQSLVILPPKIKGNIEEFGLELFYQSEERISQIVNELESRKLEELKSVITGIRKELDEYKESFKSLFKGYNVDGKVEKLDAKLEELNSFSDERFVYKTEQNEDASKYLKLKKLYFSTNNVQERSTHIVQFAYVLDYLEDMLNSFKFEKLRQIAHQMHIKV